MEISSSLSKQPFPTDSGRITLKNSLRDYVHLLKFPGFRLLVLKCAVSYSRVFTVFCFLGVKNVIDICLDHPQVPMKICLVPLLNMNLVNSKKTSSEKSNGQVALDFGS